MLSQKWSKYFNKPQARSGPKFAEKIVVAYQTARTSLKHVILYREVSELKTHEYAYIEPPKKDSEGFLVGVIRERVYDKMSSMKQAVEDLVKDGWVVETESCHEEALKILSGEIEDV
jgi:hypothetical protein